MTQRELTYKLAANWAIYAQLMNRLGVKQTKVYPSALVDVARGQ